MFVKKRQFAGSGRAGIDREIDPSGHDRGAERKRFAASQAEFSAVADMRWVQIDPEH